MRSCADTVIEPNKEAFALVFHKRLSVNLPLVELCLVENSNTTFLKTNLLNRSPSTRSLLLKLLNFYLSFYKRLQRYLAQFFKLCSFPWVERFMYMYCTCF